uniref:Uncharacterized protein n=1 Tax=Glossina austeni TaxID=7395 RepID=A0A1A9VGX6_GLOAU
MDGMEQLEEIFDKQLNSMKGDLTRLQTTLTSNVEEDVKLIEQSVKAYLYSENNEFINKTEERFQIIEDYIFKSIGLKQRQQQDKDVKKGRLTKKMVGNPMPFTITTPQADSNSKTVEFNLTLPNDDVLRINILFVKMKVSEALETKNNDYLLRDQGDDTTLTTSTTISPPVETPTTQQQLEQEKTTEQRALKYFSVDDAIEAFRKSLINSEMDIGGILEAEKPFYRHFNLKYENVDVPIRCTYKSIYEQRELKINCFEYREFEQERILSNGEIEKLVTQISEDKISTTTRTTTATTISPRISTLQTNNNKSARHGAYKLFTINDVIEAFKKDLIEKETNIGGIIESALVFHRHFNLKYENCEIRVKCSYYSNYVYRKLNIYCFEFNDIPSNFDGYDGGGGGGNQRENSNINERENQYEASPLFGRPENDIYVRTIAINDYLQTFHMSIQTFSNIVSDEDRKKLISIQAHLEDLNNHRIIQNKYGEHYEGCVWSEHEQ